MKHRRIFPERSTAQVLAVALIFAAATTGLAAQSAVAGTDGAVALVLVSKGSVHASLAGGDWKPASAGLALRQGDALRTGEDSQATLLLANDRKLRIVPNGEARFTTETIRANGISPGGQRSDLWKSLISKFAETRDLSAAKGVVGTTRKSSTPLLDAALDEGASSALGAALSAAAEDEEDIASNNLIAAVILESAGQWGRAEAAYLAAIEASPRDGRLYDTLGHLYAKAKDVAKFQDLKERKLKAFAGP